MGYSMVTLQRTILVEISTRLSRAARVVADMKDTVLGHREIKKMLRIGREFQERLGFSEKEKEQVKEKKKEQKGEGKKDNGDLEGFEQMEKP